MDESPKPQIAEGRGAAEFRARVLICDDRPANLLALKVLLEGIDADVVEASSGEHASRLLQTEEFAVVLLDVLMPGMSGFEVAKRARAQQRTKHAPIIFLTAAEMDSVSLQEGYAIGAVDFLVKPLVGFILRAKVQGFVDIYLDKIRTQREADMLRLLIQGTTDYAIFMLDPDGNIATWNLGAERLKGYTADEIIGQHFSRFYPEEAIEAGWPEHELAVATDKGRFGDEGWRLRKDGSRFWANVDITALRDQNGQLRGFSKVTRDLTRAREAEETLRRSEERFRLIVEEAKDYAIFMLDPDGVIMSWNAGAERIKGYQAKEIIGQHFSVFYPQESRDRNWPAYELEMARAEGRFEDEGWRVRKDGTTFWANVVITALRDGAGNLRGFSKITRDMTARKESEEKARQLIQEAAARKSAEQNARLIQEQRGRLHVTLASIGDAVISTDANGRVEFLNSVAEQLTGWTTNEAKEHHLEEVFHIVNETSRSPVENPALRAIKEGVIVGLANHTSLIAKDGTERSIDDSAAPIRDPDGKVVGSVLVFRDISARKRSEHAAQFLADASAALAILVDFESTLQKVASLAVPYFADWAVVDLIDEKDMLRRVAVAHVDPSKIELAKEFDRKFPISLSDTYGVGKILRTGNPQLVSEITDEILSESVKSPEQIAMLRSFGLKSLIGVPLKVRGKVIGVITFVTSESGYHYSATDLAVAQDLAERGAVAIENAKLYRELQDADRRKDEFLATLAHELRNPLAPIRNSLQILKMPRVQEEIARQTRDMMERQVHHLVRLVDDLLDVSRVMRGKIDLRKESVELATVIARAVETATPLIESQGHQLEVTVAPESMRLEADPVRLVQAFGNLLNNSAKYSESNGFIELSASADKGEATVRICDKGIGISPDVLPHIFELFVQADHTSMKAQGGLGIGLTLVKNLIEMHGGTVSATSEGLGKGAEFIVRLPLSFASTETESHAEGEDSFPPIIGHRLLVVDDNLDAASSLSMLLKLQGHDVRVAHDGQTAIHTAITFAPQAIFLDIGLPGMDGFDVARKIRSTANLEKVVLVALTGWGQQEDRRRSTEAGFDFHLVKPAEPAEVEAILSALK